jgi:16S rRNA (cytidine1402-2'-O)-methyltransferase
MAGKLYIVGTPIGNLQDLSYRAVETLKTVDAILCEDTRSTLKILERFEIKKPLLVYTEHAHESRASGYLDRIQGGESLALLSEAGMPSVSDPGARLIEEAWKRNVQVVCIPGASAVTTALAASGFSGSRFVFEGFLPRRPGRRKKILQELAAQDRTIVLFESPYRVVKTLEACLEIWGDREGAIARELTKVHEEVIRGKLSQLIEHARKNPRGEFTLVISGT